MPYLYPPPLYVTSRSRSNYWKMQVACMQERQIYIIHTSPWVPIIYYICQTHQFWKTLTYYTYYRHDKINVQLLLVCIILSNFWELSVMWCYHSWQNEETHMTKIWQNSLGIILVSANMLHQEGDMTLGKATCFIQLRTVFMKGD